MGYTLHMILCITNDMNVSDVYPLNQERIEDLLALSPEAILLRWVNHQLQCAGITRRCTNFQQDVADSEIYSYLLKQIAPNDAGVTLDALRVSYFKLYSKMIT